MSHIYKVLQYLSIDVAIGSIGSSVFAVKVVDAELPTAYWFILPLCVWIIYTSDHLLDAIKLKEQATMERHYFHFLHLKTIGVFLCLAVILSAILILRYLDKEVMMYGLWIYIFILMYLIVNHFVSRIFKFFPREFIIAFGYMAGTWGIPLLSKYTIISRSDLLFFMNYFIIILAIPLLYSIYEYDADRASGFISFATTFGVKITGMIVLILLTISTFISSVSLFLFQSNLGILMILMAAVLFAVFIFRKQLSVNDKYRSISDSVSFLPFLLLLK